MAGQGRAGPIRRKGRLESMFGQRELTVRGKCSAGTSTGGVRGQLAVNFGQRCSALRCRQRSRAPVAKFSAGEPVSAPTNQS